MLLNAVRLWTVLFNATGSRLLPGNYLSLSLRAYCATCVAEFREVKVVYIDGRNEA